MKMRFLMMACAALATVQAAAETAAEAKIEELRGRARRLVAQMTLEEKVSQLQNNAVAIDRLGVPKYHWWSEALHGVARNGRATMFPQPIGLASSFNPALVKEIGAVISDEGRAKYAASLRKGRRDYCTGLTFWSPNVNIFRDPRWGRGMETWGEDPYLTGELGAAFVQGIQGDDPVYLKASACAKHFAVHSGPERLRHTFDACPSAKDFRETYLPAFKALVQKGKVESVMSAYNRVYGESATSSALLLRQILRQEWGFKGHIVSDCGAVDDIWRGHKLEEKPCAAAARALNNGLTLECGAAMGYLPNAIKNKWIDMKVIDEALVLLFTARYRLGIMGDDPECPYSTTDESALCTPAHAELARRAARESMVLLKNDGILPIDQSKTSERMFAIGATATDAFALMGNYYGTAPYLTTYLEGLSAALDAGLSLEYTPGYYYGQAAEPGTVWSETPHTVFVFLGQTGVFEGEEGDAIGSPLNGDRSSLSLPSIQLDCLRKLCKDRDRKWRKVVTVVTGGSPVDLAEVMELSDAVIYAWYAGQEGGNALADLVFGKADFVGRLPMTFPTSLDVLPAFEDYSMKGRTYKYQTEGVQLPFGYGLSYASADYVKVEADAALKCATVTLANPGKTDAIEPVQVYVASPNAGKGAPLSVLAGFARATVPAGKTVSVKIPLAPESVGEYNEKGEFTVPSGTYRVIAGAAAPGARSRELGVKSCETAIDL